MRNVVSRPVRLALIVAVLTLAGFHLPPQSFPPKAEAAVPRVFDNFPGPPTFERDEVSDNNRLAQSFVASTSYLMTEIQLYIIDEGTPNEASVTLMSDTGLPGPDLHLTTANARGSAGVEWVSFLFATPWFINASYSYWIVLDSSGQQNNGYEWAKRTSNLYPN